MSIEEVKIREELELHLENDLEEEIKDEIYHLAFKLHRLYQHQKERSVNQQGNARKKTLSEVNINIKMEGGTTIQIKEIKKQYPVSARFTHKNVQKAQGKLGTISIARGNKFDWEKSLRSRPKNLNGNLKSEVKNGKLQDQRTGKLIRV